jgi:hypothetical protein
MTCTRHQILLGDKIENNEIGGACGIHRRETRWIQHFGGEIPGGKWPLGRPSRRWEYDINNWCSRSGMGAWTGLFWQRIASSDGLLWTRWLISDSVELGNFLTSWKTISFLRRTFLRGVVWLVQLVPYIGHVYIVCLCICVYRVESKSTDELSEMIGGTKLRILSCARKSWSSYLPLLPLTQERPTRSSRCSIMLLAETLDTSLNPLLVKAEIQRWINSTPVSWQTLKSDRLPLTHSWVVPSWILLLACKRQLFTGTEINCVVLQADTACSRRTVKWSVYIWHMNEIILKLRELHKYVICRLSLALFSTLGNSQCLYNSMETRSLSQPASQPVTWCSYYLVFIYNNCKL